MVSVDKRGGARRGSSGGSNEIRKVSFQRKMGGGGGWFPRSNNHAEGFHQSAEIV